MAVQGLDLLMPLDLQHLPPPGNQRCGVKAQPLWFYSCLDFNHIITCLRASLSIFGSFQLTFLPRLWHFYFLIFTFPSSFLFNMWNPVFPLLFAYSHGLEIYQIYLLAVNQMSQWIIMLVIAVALIKGMKKLEKWRASRWCNMNYFKLTYGAVQSMSWAENAPASLQ